MAFTYNGTLTTNLDRCRFYLQDVVSAAGPKPSDGNFTDAELEALVTLEGNWQRAVAAGFEALAAAWQKHVTYSADGLQIDRSDIAKGYAEKAADWRKQFGRAGARPIATLARTDAYSSSTTEYT